MPAPSTQPSLGSSGQDSLVKSCHLASHKAKSLTGMVTWSSDRTGHQRMKGHPAVTAALDHDSRAAFAAAAAASLSPCPSCISSSTSSILRFLPPAAFFSAGFFSAFFSAKAKGVSISVLQNAAYRTGTKQAGLSGPLLSIKHNSQHHWMFRGETSQESSIAGFPIGLPLPPIASPMSPVFASAA